MKKLPVLLTLLAVMLSAAAQDTVRYGDSIYLFNSPQATASLVSGFGAPNELFSYMNPLPYYDSLIPRRVSQAYHVDSTTWIYGVAIAQIAEFVDNPAITYQRYLEVSDSILSTNQCVFGTLHYYDSEMGTVSLAQSVPWQNPMSEKVMVYAYTHCYVSSINPPINDTVYRMHRCAELYFDSPIPVRDTFFVGIHEPNPDKSLNYQEDTCFYYASDYGGYVRIMPNVSCTYDTSGQRRWIVFPNANDNASFDWLSPAVISGISAEFYPWGGVFPILYPKEDGCTAPGRPWQTGRTATTATLEWDTIDDEVELAVDTAYQGSADSAGFVVSLAAGSSGYTVTGLQPERWYGAWLRRQCHWVTPTFDTLVWSPWTQVALFSTAAEGIAEPEQVGPEFSVYPNPAHGSFKVETEVLPSTLVLYDQRGRELYRATLRARQTTIGVGDLDRGVYHVGLTAASGTAVKRLVIE